ncbi:hypothetical protein HDZ31DRAFT_78843, partial [Schizophyllum fasciatum]
IRRPKWEEFQILNKKRQYQQLSLIYHEDKNVTFAMPLRFGSERCVFPAVAQPIGITSMMLFVVAGVDEATSAHSQMIARRIADDWSTKAQLSEWFHPSLAASCIFVEWSTHHACPARQPASLSLAALIAGLLVALLIITVLYLVCG